MLTPYIVQYCKKTRLPLAVCENFDVAAQVTSIELDVAKGVYNYKQPDNVRRCIMAALKAQTIEKPAYCFRFLQMEDVTDLLQQGVLYISKEVATALTAFHYNAHHSQNPN